MWRSTSQPVRSVINKSFNKSKAERIWNKRSSILMSLMHWFLSVQEEVYRATTKGLIEGLISGYNATVFAYGPTGLCLWVWVCVLYKIQVDNSVLLSLRHHSPISCVILLTLGLWSAWVSQRTLRKTIKKFFLAKVWWENESCSASSISSTKARMSSASGYSSVFLVFWLLPASLLSICFTH